MPPYPTKNLPAPDCIRCGRRIGYNQRSKAVGRRKDFQGWHHENCT